MSAIAQLPDYSRRETTTAVVTSILLHLLLIIIVAWGAATWHGDVPVARKEDPIEITILPIEPVKPPTPQFVRTTPQGETITQPKDALFESDNNTRAASEHAPTGDLPLPSQEGREADSLELESNDYTAGHDSQPSSPTAPLEQTQTTTPVEKAIPVPTPAPPTQLALLEVPQSKAELPAQRKPATPARPHKPSASAYQPQTRVTRLRGNISNRGKASLEVAATPLGRYKKILSDAIGSRWYYYVNNQIGLLSAGTVEIRFIVNPDGKVQNVRVTSNSSNESFASISINAIMEAEIPQIPEDVVKLLENGRIEVDYSFTILGN